MYVRMELIEKCKYFCVFCLLPTGYRKEIKLSTWTGRALFCILSPGSKLHFAACTTPLVSCCTVRALSSLAFRWSPRVTGLWIVSRNEECHFRPEAGTLQPFCHGNPESPMLRGWHLWVSSLLLPRNRKEIAVQPV